MSVPGITTRDVAAVKKGIVETIQSLRSTELGGQFVFRINQHNYCCEYRTSGGVAARIRTKTLSLAGLEEMYLHVESMLIDTGYLRDSREEE